MLIPLIIALVAAVLSFALLRRDQRRLILNGGSYVTRPTRVPSSHTDD